MGGGEEEGDNPPPSPRPSTTPCFLYRFKYPTANPSSSSFSLSANNTINTILSFNCFSVSSNLIGSIKGETMIDLGLFVRL